MVKVVKNLDGSYSINDNGIIRNNLKVIFDKRKNCGDINLGENSSGRKWLSESKFKDGINEIDLEEKSEVVNSSEKSVKLSWMDYMSKEDKEVFEEIKSRCVEKMEKNEKIRKLKELRKLEKELEEELGEDIVSELEEDEEGEEVEK